MNFKDLSGPAAALTADVAEHSKSVNTALTHSKQSVTMTANNASSVKKKKQKQQKVYIFCYIIILKI